MDSYKNKFSTFRTGNAIGQECLNKVEYINLNYNDTSESYCSLFQVKREFKTTEERTDKKSSQMQPTAYYLREAFMNCTAAGDGLVLPRKENSEKSLEDMGFLKTETPKWEEVKLPLKANLYFLLKNMITTYLKPNVEILIGRVSFSCHMMVLQCYSNYFMECQNEVVVELPIDKVTPGAFMMIYDWMLIEEPTLQRKGFLELFRAANYLQINELIKQCWTYMGNETIFAEDSAFLLYLEASRLDLPDIKKIMLLRVSKFFLTFVASKEFLEMECKELCTLLNSSMIAVNSEIEVLMSAVRWLNHDWETRKDNVVEIIKCVRFSLMPPWYLVSLSQPKECLEVQRVLSNMEVKKIIHDSLSFSTTKLFYSQHRTEFKKFIEMYKLKVPSQRKSLVDGNCEYHHRSFCPNMEHISYSSFLTYLEMIRSFGMEYWTKLVNQTVLPCCKAWSDQNAEPIDIPKVHDLNDLRDLK